MVLVYFCVPFLDLIILSTSLLLFVSLFLHPSHLPLSPLPLPRGVYDIVVSGTCVGQYNNKGSFGELALMYNTPRAATIVATQDGALWGLVRASKWTNAHTPQKTERCVTHWCCT